MAINKRKSFLSAAVLALVAAGASSPDILEAFIKEREGTELKAYQDGARVWTDCNGRTEGVKPHSTTTQGECNAWLRSEMGRRFVFVDKAVQGPMTEPARAALTSWCFNVGNTACARSTAVRLINQGNWAAGCREMLRFRYITRDGKKIDCSTNQPYCSGLWDRRQAEAELCAL